MPTFLLLRYCRQNAALQLIFIKSTLDGGDASATQWRDWIRPWLTTKAASSWAELLGVTILSWQSMGHEQQAQEIVQAAKSLDLDIAIREVGDDPGGHPASVSH